MPKYSVVIPIYNVERYLRDCVDSVLMQNTSEDYEIILIDDGSPDGSGAICDRYAQNHANIRVLHDTNHGVSHARNVGIDMAKGEYVLFLDADDLLEPDFFETLTPLLDSAADVIRYGHHRLYEDGIFYFKYTICSTDHTSVTFLTTHSSIKWRFFYKNRTFLTFY